MTEYFTIEMLLMILLLLLYYHMTEYFTNLILFMIILFVGRWGGTSQTSLRNSFRTEQGSSK